MITPATGLYVPGDRPDRFEKAALSGADLVVFDLEDAVSPARKAFARTEVVAWLASHASAPGPTFQVRVNAGVREDLAALAALPATVEVRMPKVEHPIELDRVREYAGPRPVTALLESAAGILDAERIAAHADVTRLALGEADLVAEIGRAYQVRDHARVSLVFVAAAAGLEAPMMSVYPAIEDLDGLLEDTRDGCSLGFAGRMAAHPKQLPVIRDAFRPSERDLEWAKQVLAATAAGGISRLVTGDMVDAAMHRQAERVIAREYRRDA